ncbi:MAG TPA: translocation/assembly module TamB domain-containing protein [Terracidiphilus sp.]|nr:translocation/assembly module TamB domain-containing protein [Terracidiphilus sp.]
MSEPDNPPVNVEPKRPHRSMRSRLRRFFLRHLPLAVASLAVLLVVLAVSLYFVASSSAFENAVRRRLITSLEELTGGRAEIASFHWRLLHFDAEADGVVIHGLEDPGETPYAKIDHLRAVFSLRNLFSPSIRLRSLEIDRPNLHFIVYPNGSTNQPHPLGPRTSSTRAIDTLFEMHAGRISVEQGSLDYDCRAASFDHQDRYAPLDFSANDASLVMRYIPATFRTPASYHIEAGVSDLNLARAVPRNPLPVHGTLQATLDLEHAQVFLRSLRITAERRGGQEHALEVTGDLEDFTHPQWHARLLGDLDMRLLDPITGFADAPEGLARLDISASGQKDAFQIDGGVHIEDGSYIGQAVTATGFTLDTHVHADGKQLLVTGIVVRLRQGGQLEGTVALEPWLPGDPLAHLQQTPHAAEVFSSDRNTVVRTPDWIIPVNGKVNANFKDVALDTVLDMVSPAPYRRPGFDARLNGPAVAVWTQGDGNTVSVNAQLSLSPSKQTPAGEVPTTGMVDATYAQHNGSVQVRKLELHLPQSDLEAHGTLGAYPTTGPSALTIDFHSRNLAEFDMGLRTLGLKRNGKTGAAALPVSLAGQADFLGNWSGSLARPHIAGTLQATQLAVELPAGGSGTPHLVRFDSVSASGTVSPSQIAIQHAQLQRGATRIVLNGTVDASLGASPGREPVFDSNAVLHAHFDAANLEVADVQPFLPAGGGPNLPFTGAFNAHITADGPIHALTASGSAQMERGSLYGEPASGLRVQAALAGQVLKLTSATFDVAGGNLSGSGIYDFKGERFQPGHFQIDARAENIDITRLGFLRSRNLDATGKLSFAISGSGTLQDPRLEGHAKLAALTFGGQRFGTLEATAHSAGPLLEYSATTQLEQAGLTLHGQTTLRGDYLTHAQFEFSRFNLGTLLRMAHRPEFNGESALAGTVSVDGPLAHPEQLRGEAQLRELAFTISGVQLQGDGGLHATLADGRIHLDPLHVTGENTDLHVQGDLSLKGAQQLDLAASGSIDLKLAETLDPDLTASGLTTFKVQAHGPLQHPNLQGSIDFQNGALSLEDLPNGLSQLHGTLEFNQNRLEVKNLTAMSGGGLLTVGGSLAYQHGIYADLSVTGKQVHIRYPEGVSSLADATFHLQGQQNNLFLSGNVLITRFSVSPDLDLAALATQANVSIGTIAPPDAPSNHVRLDVHIVSSPQLSFQNAFAKLAGDVDLSLRGTLASPSLLGRVSVTEGSALIAGTRYDLERGDITFTNPVRVEPIIDLSATAHVEDYDISLGLHGSPQKLSVSYRSDPPLPEADVVSLLALGHTASQQRLYTQQQEQTIANPTDALLGGALNATVSSRVQKLFGAGSVKVDPNYLGAFGNSTSRITVQEQFGRSVILTYATDVNTTSQQLLQAEVAINRHVSVVVARDESGVFSMVIKATRRFR